MSFNQIFKLKKTIPNSNFSTHVIQNNLNFNFDKMVDTNIKYLKQYLHQFCTRKVEFHEHNEVKTNHLNILLNVQKVLK